MIPTNPRELLPLHGGTVDSLNWSGYAVTLHGPKVTAVSSTFRVPAAGQVPPGFAATRSGIGGHNTQDLIQAAQRNSLRPWRPKKIVLSLGGAFTEATPSALGSDGQSFHDCAYSQSCKAP